jgi:methyl-accepting chemotaxis protein
MIDTSPAAGASGAHDPSSRASLALSQARAARWLAWGAWAHAPVLCLAMLLIGGPALWVTALSLALSALAEATLRGTAEIGHAWQVDTHMYFFAILAALAAMVDLRAILAGAGMIALHHVGLNLLMPTLIYPGGADMGRTLLHAGVVVLETGALGLMVHDRQRLNSEMTGAFDDLTAARERERKAEESRREAAEEGARLREIFDEQLERGVGRMVERGLAGDFGARIELDVDGEMLRRRSDALLLRISERLNDLFAKLDTVFGEFVDHLDALAGGDLSHRTPEPREGRFEHARVKLNETSAALADLVGDLAVAVSRTEDATGGMEREVGSVASRAESQAASLQETAATMEQIASTVSANSERLSEAERMAGEIDRRTRDGETAARAAVEAVGRIEQSSGRISDIVTVIDSIAFQTNLLALNAAVEAARAGEAGKGFAVVAAEVRTLAQRSSEAARDVGQLIGESGDHVAEGVREVQRTGQALDAILEGMQGLAQALTDTAAAGREQSDGVGEVNSAVAQLDGDTQENAAAAERAASAAAGLREEIGALAELAGRFRVATPGRAGTQAA